MVSSPRGRSYDLSEYAQSVVAIFIGDRGWPQELVAISHAAVVLSFCQTHLPVIPTDQRPARAVAVGKMARVDRRRGAAWRAMAAIVPLPLRTKAGCNSIAGGKCLEARIRVAAVLVPCSGCRLRIKGIVRAAPAWARFATVPPHALLDGPSTASTFGGTALVAPFPPALPRNPSERWDEINDHRAFVRAGAGHGAPQRRHPATHRRLPAVPATVGQRQDHAPPAGGRGSRYQEHPDFLQSRRRAGRGRQPVIRPHVSMRG